MNNLTEKINKYLNEGRKNKKQINYYINKFKNKMEGSSVETAVYWIDGIGEINSKEKAQIYRGIHNYIGDKDINQSTKNNLRKKLQWYNDNF